jgi:valyl-tRNA synthetase
MTAEMNKTFEPREIEGRWYPLWENRGYFAPRDAGKPGAPHFCIMIPPPNVTGSLHMGHAFQDTLMDALTRYHRMKGDATLWQPGTDHAGIATQMVVERQLAAEDLTRHDLGREKFVERVWQWKSESGGTITRQLRRLGASVDWSRERFTMDDAYSRAVTEHFVRLHEQGLVYRGKRLVNWDPVLLTAISDLEVVSEEEAGQLWHLRYPLADGSGQLVVATTRPETMLGDTAVAVHPDDERYRSLIGSTIRLPLSGREIPVIGDEYVDPEFGSGCVKITPAHDFNDYAVGQRHGLPLINVFTPDARINDNAPARYQGLDRFAARKQVVADLESAGLLERIDAHKLMVPRGDRSGSVIEPYLTDQWFVDLTRDTLPDGRPGGHRLITQPAIRAVEDGRIRFVPENWSATYFQWLRNIQDWCISRQLWWGHRIPAWYDEAGNIHVARNEAEAREKYGLAADLPLHQDEDTFDTWFSSDLWPLATLGWPDQDAALKAFYPTSVLVTGFDIIFFWVARMVMMGLHFGGDVPFREVYIHGLVRDAEGQKMSKSKGNVLDPLDIIDGIGAEQLVAKRTSGMMQPHLAKKIEKATRREFPEGIAAYGADALRFTFAALATSGRDIRFDLGRVSGYRNFCNKLWNAARYVLMNTDGRDCGQDDAAPLELSLADRWIVSRLQHAEAEVARNIETYRFDLAAQALYEFAWYEFCDWYLELSKPALQSGTEAAQRGTRRTLVRTLEALLRLAHPFMPFITEDIWQRVAPLAGRTGETIMLQPYPLPEDGRRDALSETEMGWLQGFILGLRQIRGEMDIAPSKPLPVLVANASAEDVARLARHRPLIDFLARVQDVRVLGTDEPAPECATALLGEMKILVPMAGLIDKAVECARLQKQIDLRRKAATGSEARLSNAQFVSNAPAEVVEKERAGLAEHIRVIAELEGQLARIQAL